MKALVNTSPNVLEWKDWPTPEIRPGQVRIRTAACGICATDLEMIGGWSRTGFPAIPGHEWAGYIDAVGPNTPVSLIGRKCVAENVLADGGEVGFEHAGGYGQYLITEPPNLHCLPSDFPTDTAALIEPLAVCVRALNRLRLKDKRSALIFGDGPIGLLMLLLLKLEGVEKVALVGGGQAVRLATAQEFGADAILNYHTVGKDLAQAVRKLSGGPFLNVIEASGSSYAMNTAMNVTAKGGKILIIGDYADNTAGFPWNQILHQELELIGSNASAGAWPRAVELATSGKIPLHRLISKRISADSGVQAVELVRTSRDLIKVVLQWPER